MSLLCCAFDCCFGGYEGYNTDTSAGDSGGVINASNPITTTAPDASGGNGSFLGVLQNTLTNGLNSGAIDENDFGLGTLANLLTGNTAGDCAPLSAPTTIPGSCSASSGVPSWVWIGAAIAVVAVVVLAARR